MKLWQAPRAPATAPPITIKLSIPILDAKQDPDIDNHFQRLPTRAR